MHANASTVTAETQAEKHENSLKKLRFICFLLWGGQTSFYHGETGHTFRLLRTSEMNIGPTANSCLITVGLYLTIKCSGKQIQISK